MSMNEFRGSNGQSLNAMQMALETAMNQQKPTSTTATKPTAARFSNPNRVAAAASAATTPAPVVDTDLPNVPEDSVLWFRHDIGYNFVPRTGVDGTIVPTIGWLIDVLGLQYIERKTAQGTHLVILRNDHVLRQDTEINSLYHFYFPVGSTTVLAVLDTAEGAINEIITDIETRQDNFQLVTLGDEMAQAFAITSRMALVAYEMATVHPMMRKRMDYWHKADYLPGMNYQ